ncbi:hypothetical protein A2U01_0023917 [Trifolium medium]|uniref:Uncharacterized protein n=1 Tax=Trifolium medium TaxID=97028 RepID=A0A392NSU5_9FABA|nr:hypothetical protein [Trifolium medium]
MARLTHLYVEKCGIWGSIPGYFMAHPISVKQKENGNHATQLMAVTTINIRIDLGSPLNAPSNSPKQETGDSDANDIIGMSST